MGDESSKKTKVFVNCYCYLVIEMKFSVFVWWVCVLCEVLILCLYDVWWNSSRGQRRWWGSFLISRANVKILKVMMLFMEVGVFVFLQNSKLALQLWSVSRIFEMKSVTVVVSFGELKVVTLFFFFLQEVRLNMEAGIASLRESHAQSKRAKQVKRISQNRFLN